MFCVMFGDIEQCCGAAGKRVRGGAAQVGVATPQLSITTCFVVVELLPVAAVSLRTWVACVEEGSAAQLGVVAP
jgi:hypothetical protein